MTEREQFEAWWNDVDRAPWLMMAHGQAIAWAAWQAARSAVPAEPVAWMMTPNEKSHPRLTRDAQFDKPVDREDWTLTPLYAFPPRSAEWEAENERLRALLREALPIVEETQTWDGHTTVEPGSLLSRMYVVLREKK